MSRVKIVSNPYARSVTFLNWSDGSWIPIDAEHNPNSALLGRQVSEGFFPFKVRRIVEVILAEYGDGGVVDIEFEGPDDEWIELVDACAAPNLRERVSLARGVRLLANARDILPFVRSEFEGIYPIIASQEDALPEACELLRKLRDAMSDVVPICVVGNYSSGKSTFINALIGAELLPSSDKPLTARIFRIEKSSQPDRACIQIEYSGEPLNIYFAEQGMTCDPPLSSCPLIKEIESVVSSDDARPIVDRARRALTVINGYKPVPNEELGNLVAVQAPFRADDWTRGKQLVIFDTPGSNSNSNAEHLKVLQEAMRGMSDGLPIYVTEFSSLDSNDNAALYDEICQMEALDERFAMIVVNKADAADLPEDPQSPEHVDYVMSTTVARNLYAQGIYHVSSIMGLGAKTGGEFEDRHYERCYRQLLSSYEDPEDRYYTRLYQYNIMPAQLRARSLHEAELCSERVLANGGLYSVERGVEEFATKYAVYNKCSRSNALLSKLVEQTDDALEEASERCEESRRLGQVDLDANREQCLEGLSEKTASLRREATGGYLPFMNKRDYLEGAAITSDILRDWEKDFSESREREMGVGEKDRAAKEASEAVGARFRERFSGVLDSMNILGFKDLTHSLIDDMSKAAEAQAEKRGAQRVANQAVSKDLLLRIQQHFDVELSRAMNDVERCSREYWERCSENARGSLLGLVTDGMGIDSDRRETLRDIILDFRPLSLAGTVPEIKDIRSPFDEDKLWKMPIALQHNFVLTQRVSRWRAAVEPAHEDSFLSWLDELSGNLAENIVDLSPELSKKLAFIRTNERELADLQAKRDRLRRAEERVSEFMSWRGGE